MGAQEIFLKGRREGWGGKEGERKDEISGWITGDINETFCKGITEPPNTKTHKEKAERREFQS